jgi:hypothetical protein
LVWGTIFGVLLKSSAGQEMIMNLNSLVDALTVVPCGMISLF